MPTTDECYRILEIERGASEEEVRRAWRELSKVWHPDRFGTDAELRGRAEEKLKRINEAYETLRNRPRSGFHREAGQPHHEADEWRIRGDGQEAVARNFRVLVEWILRGNVTGSDEVYHPRLGRWVHVEEIPELARALQARKRFRFARWGIPLILLGIGLLVRRPTAWSMVIALVLIFAGWALIRSR